MKNISWYSIYVSDLRLNLESVTKITERNNVVKGREEKIETRVKPELKICIQESTEYARNED